MTPKIKVLTGVRVAQTAGIAQVVFSFLGFVEKNRNNNLNDFLNLYSQEQMP